MADDTTGDIGRYLEILSGGDATVLLEVRPIWAAGPGGKSTSRGKAFWGTVEEILSHVPTLRAYNADQAHIYVGILPRKAHGCGNAEGSLPGFVIAVDVDDGRSLAEILAAIAKAGLPPPTMIVCSCDGLHKYHVYWALDERLPDVDTAERAMSGLIDALHTDATVKSAAQLLRLPTFTNTKPDRGGRVVLLEAHPERRYPLSMFPLAEEVPPAPPPRPLAELPVQIAPRSMSDATRDLFAVGVEEFRRQAIYTAACDMSAREWPLEEALEKLMQRGEELGLEGFEVTDLRRQIHRAYAKQRTPGRAAAEVVEIDFEASAPNPYDVGADFDELPLPELPAWPSRPDVALSHGALGEVVATLEEQTEADAVSLAVQVMIAFGSVVGRGPHAMVGATRHGLNLFCSIVGETGKARKGTGLDLVRCLMREVDPSWAQQCVSTNLSSGEGVIDAIRDPVTKFVANKTTGEMEPVIVDPGVADKRLLVACTELAGPLRASKNERSTLSPTLREAWDGHALQTLAKNAARRVAEPHVSVISHITREELVRLATEADVFGGLFNRFLWPLSKRVRFLPEGGDISAVPHLGDLIRERVDLARQTELIVRTTAAKEYWASLYPGLTTVPEGGVLGAILGRGEAQTLRLSVLMALMANRQVVDVPDLLAAHDLWLFCADSARVIFAPASGIGSARLGHRIVEVVTAAPEGITRRDLANRLHIRREQRAEFLLELARAQARGALVVVTESTGGRPREVWKAAEGTYAYKPSQAVGTYAYTAPAPKTVVSPVKNEVPAPAVAEPGLMRTAYTESPKPQKPAFDLSKPLAPGTYTL